MTKYRNRKNSEKREIKSKIQTESTSETILVVE